MTADQKDVMLVAGMVGMLVARLVDEMAIPSAVVMANQTVG